MIEAQGVSKRYEEGTLAVDQLSLKIDQGEFIAVIGLSGAGKTTLLRLLNGTLRPTAGTLRVLDVDLGHAGARDLRALRQKIGFIFQQFNLVRRLTAMQNVLAGRLGYHGAVAGLLGLYSDDDIKMAAHYLDEVGLQGRYQSRTDQLSGGQQQRVAIARALVQGPKIILADEPAASLDPRLSEVVLSLLQQFNQKEQITVIVNIHVLELARRYATRVIGMRQGKIVYDGKPGDLTDGILKEIYDR